LTIERLADLLREGAKPAAAWSIGIEVEKMGVDAAGRPLPYDGTEASIRSVLEVLAAARPSVTSAEAGNLIAREGDGGTITRDPGGQVEWPPPASASLVGLSRGLREHLALLEQAGERLGIRWLQTALQPDTPLAEMPWMPKQRYRIMRDYFAAHG